MRVKISDHAIIRHMERVMKLDLDVIRKEILDKDTIAGVKLRKGKCSIIKNGYNYIFNNYNLITVKKNCSTVVGLNGGKR